jgi:hypothetical protein
VKRMALVAVILLAGCSPHYGYNMSFDAHDQDIWVQQCQNEHDCWANAGMRCRWDYYPARMVRGVATLSNDRDQYLIFQCVEK